VGGLTVILPRNLVIELPANFLTLSEMYDQSPGNCKGVETGLALQDTCDRRSQSAVATILANRLTDGRVIAGEVFIERGQETITGVVTSVDFDNGKFVINGQTMLRMNDPTARHTIQRGPGCTPIEGTVDNCSPDVRFAIDSDNYTTTFATGYPACIPSTHSAANMPNDPRTQNRNGQSDSAGRNDPFCPEKVRLDNGGRPVKDSRFFAPIRIGDHITAEGSLETVGGTTFFSAHTFVDHVALTTSPGKPDYVIFDEAEWDTAGFQNSRVRMLMIGFSTLTPTDVEVYALDKDLSGINHERVIASSAGCDALGGVGACTNQGIGLAGAGIWKIRYDVDFLAGVDFRRRTPCGYLTRVTLFKDAPPCPGFNYSLLQEVSVILPNTREIIARSRNKALSDPGPSFDIKGTTAPNGEYLTPVAAGHPEFVEVNLNAIQTPFIFEGQLWNLDRRNHPVGCLENPDGSTDCGPVASVDDVRLTPFPVSCLDPAGRTNAVPPGGIDVFRNLILTPLQGAGGPLALPTCPGNGF